MNTPKLILLSCLLLSFLACEEEPQYQDVREEPSVFFRGSIDGDYVDWQAGVDNEYNFTAVEVNEFDFYNLQSSLSDIDNRGPKLEIKLLDPGEIESSLSPDERFKIGSRAYLYQPDAIRSYKLQLHSSQLSDYLHDYEWITDEGIFHTSDPEITFSSLGAPLICLKGQTVDGDTIHTCKRIDLDQNRWISPRLSLKEQGNDSITVEANVDNMVCDGWVWNGYSSEAYGFTVAREDWAKGKTHLEMYNGNILIADILFRGEWDANADPTIGWPGFSHELLERKIKDRLQHGKVIINYTDPSLGLFSSKYVDSDSNSFQILDAQPFQKNENDLDTWILDLKFEATIATELGHEIQIKSEKVQMAFPLPKS